MTVHIFHCLNINVLDCRVLFQTLNVICSICIILILKFEKFWVSEYIWPQGFQTRELRPVFAIFLLLFSSKEGKGEEREVRKWRKLAQGRDGKVVWGNLWRERRGGQLPLRATLGYVKKIFKELGLAAYYVMQFPYATNFRPTVKTTIIF